MFATNYFPMTPRAILSTVLLAASTTSAFSQQTNNIATQSTQNPKWVVGLNVGNALQRNSMFAPIDGTSRLAEYAMGLNANLFARYYVNDNFAIETGLGMTIFKSRKLDWTLGYAPNRMPTDRGYAYATNVMLEIPIEFQYHFFDSKAKFRPYFGIGASVYTGSYRVKETYDENNGGTTEYKYNYNNRGYSLLNFSQGMTYQVTDKLQFNQSLKFRLDGSAVVNINFGLGYTIGK